MLNEKMQHSLVESLKGLCIGSVVLFRNVIRFYVTILAYLMLWPVLLTVNLMKNR